VWIVVAMILGAAAAVWLSLAPGPGEREAWLVAAGSPWIVGAPDDPFSYDGTHGVSAEGGMSLRWEPQERSGQIEAHLQADDGSWLRLLTGPQTGSALVVRSRQLTLETREGTVYGDSGRGGTELPQTWALLAGTGRFALWLDGTMIADELAGRWSVNAAVRRADGSVRANGLVYSPLLRDKTGFSDPERMECTLILTRIDAQERRSALLHLVFQTVTIGSEPSPDR
jgi:hypothetical protein